MSGRVGVFFVVNIYCRIRTMVKAVVVAFVIGAASGFLMGSGNDGGRLDSPSVHDTTVISGPARVVQ